MRPEKFQRRMKSMGCCLFLFKPSGFDPYYWRDEGCNIKYCTEYCLGFVCFFEIFKISRVASRPKMTLGIWAGKAFSPLKKSSIEDLGAHSCSPLGPWRALPSLSSQGLCGPERVRAGEQSRCGRAHRWQSAVWMSEVSVRELLVNTLRRNVILLLCTGTIVWYYNTISTNRTATRSILIMILAFNHQILSLCGDG